MVQVQPANILDRRCWLFGGWLGWNLYEIRERNRCLDYLKANGASIREYDDDAIRPPWRMSNFPRMWQLLGVRPVRSIGLGDGRQQLRVTDAKLIAPFFPEAMIIYESSGPTSQPVDIQ